MNSAPYTPEAPASPQQAQKLLPAITELRLRYLRSGYTPLPCVGKAPALSNWPKARIDATQIRAWPMLFPTALNIGIRSRYNPAADIDVYDADLVHTIERALLKYLPQDKLILRRVGVAPKRLIPFCGPTPFPKCAIAFKSPDGKTHRVEVLADGQQYIAEGWHPDSGEPYGWMGEKLSDVLPTKLTSSRWRLTGAVGRWRNESVRLSRFRGGLAYGSLPSGLASIHRQCSASAALSRKARPPREGRSKSDLAA
jgi:Bifunctional DNA primase/polymerase, N-terminal